MITENNNTATTEQTRKPLTETLTIELKGNSLSVDKYMNFLNALAKQVKYSRDEKLEDHGLKKRLFESLVPTSKGTAKRALLASKLTKGQIKELRQNSGYIEDGEFLKSTSYKG